MTEARINFTPIVENLGKKSELTFTIGESATHVSVYDLLKIEGTTFRVQRLDGERVGGPPLTFVPRPDQDPDELFLQFEVLRFRSLTDPAASIALGRLRDVVVARRKR